MSEIPTTIERLDAARIAIRWSDGMWREYGARDLRDACPCATCREKRSAPPAPGNQLPLITPEEARPIEIAAMKPVGNYAYNIAFSDGHSSGIFTMALLRQLGQVRAEAPSPPT